MRSRVTVEADGGSRVTGWSGTKGEATTLILLRHGVTPATERKVFSGSSGANPSLTETGREQAGKAAKWIAQRSGADAIISSPLTRTRETAEAVAAELRLDVAIEAGLAETSFGDWDGHTFAEIQERWPTEMTAWLGSTAVAPPGGDTFDAVDERVQEARERILQTYAGQTVVAVSHVTPIKLLVKQALGASMQALYRMELSPASITTITWWSDGNASVRNFNVVPD